MYEQTNTMMETKTSFQIPQLLDAKPKQSRNCGQHRDNNCNHRLNNLRIPQYRLKLRRHPTPPNYPDKGYVEWQTHPRLRHAAAGIRHPRSALQALMQPGME